MPGKTRSLDGFGRNGKGQGRLELYADVFTDAGYPQSNGSEDFLDYYPYQEEWTQKATALCRHMRHSSGRRKMSEKNVYLQILNQATDYVYINTPYLIVDEKVQTKHWS